MTGDTSLAHESGRPEVWDGYYRPGYAACRLFGEVYGWYVSKAGGLCGWLVLYRRPLGGSVGLPPTRSASLDPLALTDGHLYVLLSRWRLLARGRHWDRCIT